MRCTSCQFDNPQTMKFCVECGSPLLVRCGHCGSEMQPHYKFCGECGQALGSEGAPPGPSPAAPAQAVVRPTVGPSSPGFEPVVASPAAAPAAEGERKQVTILRCTLVTPVSGAEAPSADEQHDLLSHFFEWAQAEVERFGGTLRRLLNSGFMALFGAPVVWEDHPHRAVLAARGLQDKVVPRVNRQYGAGYGLQIGIDSGDVVLGGVGGMVVGATMARAGALEQRALPGEVLISERTAHRVQGQVVLEASQPVVLEGQSIATFQALADGDARQTALLNFDESSLSPFLGREHEMATLEQLRHLASQQQGQIIGLTGDAGAGKSRLLHELYRRTRAQGQVSYLRGQCLSYGSGVPYLPLIDMFRQASNISDSDDPQTILTKTRRSLEQVGTDPDSLPYFLRLLGVEQGTEALAGLEPRALQKHTFAVMRRMLLDASQHALVVIEIEDVHWIDETSAEFFSSLVEIMAVTRILLIMTYRPGHQPKWLEKSFATQIVLRRLTEDDSRQLALNLLARSDHALELDESLLAKAEGNPLFLEEIIHSLAENSSQGAKVPDTVQGILMARIDRLPKEHQKLLRTASVLGRSIQREVLAEIWEDHPATMDALLEDLQRWELLHKAPSEDRDSYLFKHALTQEVAYDSLLASHRQSLHTAAARAFERLHADHLEEVYPQLMYHYPKAGDAAKTVHYSTLFAERAAAMFAHAEAAKALREALPHVGKLPSEGRHRRLVEVLLQLAESLLPLAAFPETLELFEAHLEELEATDDASLEGRYYFWLAHTHTYLGHQQQTRELAEKSIAAAQRAEDEATEGKACYVLGRDGFWSGQFRSGIDSSLRAVVLLERTGEAWWQGQAHWVAGFNHYALGQFKEAIEALERCCAIGEALDDYRLDASWSLGYFYASLGDAEKGIAYCKLGLEASQDPLNSAVSSGFLGFALWIQGSDLTTAVDLLTDAVGRMRQAGMQQLEGWFSVFLGKALLGGGRLDEARRAALSGLETTHAAGFAYGTGLARLTLGKIEAAAEHWSAAAEHLSAGEGILQGLEVPFELARLRLEQAKLAHRNGRQQDVEHLLRQAMETFDRLRLPDYMQQTTTLGQELGVAFGIE